MNDLVSVIVPVYNVERYLDRCIQSIVKQTYPYLEIILVDDGSPDNCPVMCDHWAQKDPRIRVVHKANAGLGMARNTGIEHARGKYIFFFDSDDYVDLTVVEKCVMNAQKYSSEVVMFGRYDVYDDIRITEKKVTSSKLFFCDDAVSKELLPHLFTYEMGFGVSAWGKMFQVETIRKHGLKFRSEREIISEDAYFMLELLSKVTVATIVPECLYYYCKRSDSLSRGYRKDRQSRNDDFLKQCMDYVKDARLPALIIRHIQSRYHGLSLGTLTQIIRSDLVWKEKRKALREIYRNETLNATLTKEVLMLDAKFPRIFWRCLKNKCYWLCTLLLCAKMKR